MDCINTLWETNHPVLFTVTLPACMFQSIHQATMETNTGKHSSFAAIVTRLILSAMTISQSKQSEGSHLVQHKPQH